MKTALTIFTAVVLSVLAGCADGEKDLLTKKKQLLSAGKELLTVDFQQDQTLRYKFVSSRDIDVDWNPGKSGPKPEQTTVDKTSESMDMVVAYTPVKVDPYGLTTIKATCESVQIKRSKGRREFRRQNFYLHYRPHRKNRRLFEARQLNTRNRQESLPR
ncbi:MAG: hypothetical protein ACYTEO_18300 [Planctomycetota bacterium]